jgi:hypothetical protein
MKTRSACPRFFVLFFAVTLISSTLFGQPNQRRQGPPMLPDSTQIVHMVDELSTTLSLTDDQETQVSDLYFNHFAQIEEMMQDNPDREKMDKLKKDFEKEVMAVLNDDQKTKYTKMMKERGPGQPRPRH